MNDDCCGEQLINGPIWLHWAQCGPKGALLMPRTVLHYVQFPNCSIDWEPVGTRDPALPFRVANNSWTKPENFVSECYHDRTDLLRKD